MHSRKRPPLTSRATGGNRRESERGLLRGAGLSGLAALALLLTLIQPSWGSEKKGVAIADPAGTRVTALHVARYYNWQLSSSAESLSGCFVPMLWGSKSQVNAVVSS